MSRVALKQAQRDRLRVLSCVSPSLFVIVLICFPLTASASEWSSSISAARSQSHRAALASYERALASLKASPSPDFRREIAMKEMAIVLLNLKRVDEAKVCMQQLLKMQEQSYAPRSEIYNSLWMLHVYEKNVHNLVDAQRYARAMIDVAREMHGDDRSIFLASATEELSETLLLDNRPADAARLLASTELLSDKPQLAHLKARILLQKARVSNLTAKYDSAIAYATEALSICPGGLVLQIECRQALSETYLFQKQYGKSIVKTEEVLKLLRRKDTPQLRWCSEKRCLLQLSQLVFLDGRSPQSVCDWIVKALAGIEEKTLPNFDRELCDRIDQVYLLSGVLAATNFTKILLTVPNAPPEFIRCLKKELGVLYLLNDSTDAFSALRSREVWSSTEVLKMRERVKLLKPK